MLSQSSHVATSSVDKAIRITLEPLPNMDDLAILWQSLENRADNAFFLSWTWIGTWLRSISRRPELLIARIDGDVVGLGLVLSRLIVRHRLMPIWTLFLNQTGDPDQDVITIEYNDILADRRFEQDVRSACLRFLIVKQKIGGRRVGELVIGGLHEKLTSEVTRLERPVREVASTGSARVDLKAIRQSGGTYQESLKSSIARRLRRAQALYHDRGTIELLAARSVEEALDFFESAGALHQQRWTAKGYPGAFAYPFYIDFHRRLIRAAFPEARVELVRVTAAGVPIGYLYNFLYRKRVYYYFSGFRFETDNRLKPGLVCHMLCIERHLANGLDLYDFMGGEQRYKTELGEPGPHIIALAIQCPNLMLAAERPLRRLKQALTFRQHA